MTDLIKQKALKENNELKQSEIEDKIMAKGALKLCKHHVMTKTQKKLLMLDDFNRH